MRVVQWTAWNAPGGSEDRLINARTIVVSRAKMYSNPRNGERKSEGTPKKKAKKERRYWTKSGL
jgi:hypothetical protein